MNQPLASYQCTLDINLLWQGLESVTRSALFIIFPVAVPTSFEGPFGKIVYRVKAVIDTPRFSKDYKAHRPFYLLNLLNLNEVPDIEVRNCCTLLYFPKNRFLNLSLFFVYQCSLL